VDVDEGAYNAGVLRYRTPWCNHCTLRVVVEERDVLRGRVGSLMLACVLASVVGLTALTALGLVLWSLL